LAVQQPKVVVIDDEPDFCAIVQEFVSTLGWQVAICPDGLSAQQCVREEQPDVIILDLWLESPEMGWVVLETLAADPETAQIPVVVCTGAVDQLRKRAAFLQERDAIVLEKPFDLRELEQVLTEAVIRRRPRAHS
jgi:CheY-like chemotaxis protein